MKNFLNSISLQRSGHFVAHHPDTKIRLGTFDSWCEAFNCIVECMKGKK